MTMAQDFHNQEFDSGTLIKLDIFQRYLREWLPVFFAGKYQSPRVNIFDYFAGPGSDPSGSPGSPLLAVQTALEYIEKLEASRTLVSFYFFDQSKKKIEALRNEIKKYENVSTSLRIHIEHSPFEDALAKTREALRSGSNLVFIDQCGIKQVTAPVFQVLASSQKTDLLFFSASSFLKRFASTGEFARHHDVNLSDIRAARYSDIHRLVAEHYKKMIPKPIRYHVAPFSIKKDSNIYGLVFGSGHVLGLKKFLDVCWKIDPNCGEANYDIDEDQIGPTPSLFPEWNIPKKLQAFSSKLEEEIILGRVQTDAAAFIFALESGCLGVHARDVVTALINKGLLSKCDPKSRLRFSVEAIDDPRSFTAIV